MYLESKFGITRLHVCQPFRGLYPSLSFMQGNVCSLGSCAPFTLPDCSNLKAPLWDFQCCGGSGRTDGGGILHHAKAHPSTPMPKHHVCRNNLTESYSMFTQALSGEAKYTLSYQRQRMRDRNSPFFSKHKHIYYTPSIQAVQIKIGATKRKNKHGAVTLFQKLENRTSKIWRIQRGLKLCGNGSSIRQR